SHVDSVHEEGQQPDRRSQGYRRERASPRIFFGLIYAGLELRLRHNRDWESRRAKPGTGHSPALPPRFINQCERQTAESCRRRLKMNPNSSVEDLAVFNARFSRCRRLLCFVARHVLGCGEKAQDAVQKCWRRACCSPPKFRREGAFRSWLVRILLDEAFAI